ncbi:MAG: DMT family transporter [Acidimicrobiia bacterium]|nr:DMT family transporter [Acidimicrobiia bacterium]
MVTPVLRALVGEGELSYRQGASIVLISGVMFSFTALLFRALDNANDWQFLTMRGGSTALVLLVVAYVRRRGRPVRFDEIDWKVALAGVLLAVMSMLFILALARTTAALTTFLLAAAPFFGALFGRVFLGEKVSMVTVGAMATAMSGVAVMVGSGIEAGQTAGVVFAALIPLVLGLYNVLLRSKGSSVDPILPAIIAGGTLVVVAGFVSVLTVGLAMSLRDILLGFAAGGVILGIGLPLFNLGHRSVPTAQVSLLNLSEIVLAPIWVWIWPGEIPATATLIGGAIVLVAVIYLVVASDRQFRLAAR